MGTQGGGICEQGAHFFLGRKPRSRSPPCRAGPLPGGKWGPHRGVGPTPSFLETQDQGEKRRVGLEALSGGWTSEGPGVRGFVSPLGLQLLFLLQRLTAVPGCSFGSGRGPPGVGARPGLWGWVLGEASSRDCPAGVSGPGPQPAPGPAPWDLPEGAVAPQGIVPGDGTPTWARGAVLRGRTQAREKAGSLHLLAGETTETLASHMQLMVRHLFRGGREGRARGEADSAEDAVGLRYVKAGSAMLWSGLQVKAMVTA